MPGAVIVIDQVSGAGLGTPGVARDDLWELQEVTLHVGTSGNSSYEWEILNAPDGSAATLDTPDQETCHFTPDLIGTYRVRLITNGGGPGNVQILVMRVANDNAGALKNRGWAYPAVGEQLGENNFAGNDRAWAKILEFIFEDIRLNGMGGGGSITLGGDLDDWVPTPSSAEQRVVGLNTVPIPNPELPTHRDLLQAQAELLLSDMPFDITSDGTGVWVGDIQSPASSAYGGLVNVLFPDEVITTRFEYDAAGLGSGSNIQIWSVVYLGGYLYVTGLAGVFATPYVAKVDPADGSILDGAPIAYMAYVRTDGTYLYLMAPHPSKNNPAFFWVDPADLTTQTPFDPFPANYNPGVIGFAYDSVLGNVWLSAMGHDEILVVNATTHATAFTVATVAQPSDSVYAGGFVWVLQGSDLDYGANYTPGHPYNQYYVSYGVYTYTSSLAWLDPTDGSLLGTVSDPNSLIVGAIRMEYDSTNGCIWVVCDSPAPFAPGSPPTPLGPRLVRVDVATQTITGWCSLDITFNMGIAVGGGYVWVVDSPAGDPGGGGGFTILKIDPAEVGNPAVVPGTTAPGIIARITGGPIAYQFIKKNQDIVKVDTNLSATVTVLSEQETVLVRGSSTVNLPTSPVDGERHTIVDYNQDIGYWGNIIVIGWNGYSVATVAQVSTAGGSVTVIWSATVDRWVVI